MRIIGADRVGQASGPLRNLHDSILELHVRNPNVLAALVFVDIGVDGSDPADPFPMLAKRFASYPSGHNLRSVCIYAICGQLVMSRAVSLPDGAA